MSRNPLSATIVDDIECYSLDMAEDYADYPEDGFDVTEKLEKKSFWVSSRTRILKKLINQLLPKIRPVKLLEVGCGTGTFIEQLVDDTNLHITGSEVYLRGIFYAKQKIPSVKFVQYDVSKGALPDRFDIIGAFDVLEHIEDDASSIKNIYDMLEDGGYFILTVPQYMFMWSKVDEIVKHKRRYARNEMLVKLRSKGFVIEYTTSFVFVLFPLMLISRLLDRGKAAPDRPEDHDFESRVNIPSWMNWLFNYIMRIDEFLISMHISLPFGGSLLVIARKPKGN